MTLFYDTPAENMFAGDVFLMAGKKCAVEWIGHEDGATRILFSFLDTPDYGGAFGCRSATNFTIIRTDRRSTTV